MRTSQPSGTGMNRCFPSVGSAKQGFAAVIVSRAYVPETITGLEALGVFSLKTVDDAVGMAQLSQNTDRAVMLGGGILNLKAAFALLEKNIKVTLVVYSPEVLSQLMDPGDAFLVRKALDTAGLEIMTGYSATDVITDVNGVCAIALNNGKELPCQMICVGKGVIPNTDFIKASNINIDKESVKLFCFSCLELQRIS